LNTAEAALYLKVSERSLKEWRWHGKGPPIRRHAGHVLYHIDELEQWSQDSGEARRAREGGA
jgi:predicted site-specific integrase-resolvase